MKATLYLILFAVLQAGINARGIVDAAEISGVDNSEISQETRNNIQKLVGQPFDQQAADHLADLLLTEKPEFTTTIRLVPGNEPDHVKVIFSLEKNSGADNVNSRYIVERVEIQGFDESRLSQSIRDEIKKLVGARLDQDKANEIQRHIEDALRPSHNVSRRVAKGSDRQHIVVVYEIHRIPWIPFIEPTLQHLVYHSKQNFSFAGGGNIVDNNSARLYVGAVDDQDRLLERFAGFNLGFEARRIWTDRLGLALRYARYHNRWQPATELADRNAIYRNRSSFDPSITFAFDPRVRVTAGVSLSDFQMQYPAIHGENANAAVAAINLQNSWGSTDTGKHSVRASYSFRAGTHQFDSDFIFTRHSLNAEYLFSDKQQDLLLRFSLGTLAGNAPLLDRFSLGDTSTLRGWNKFDIAPLGGNRMAHGTVQYGFQLWGGQIRKPHVQINTDPFAFHVFYDAGVVGDRGSPMNIKHSIGFGIGGREHAGWYAELGFPIRSSHVVPMFMMGFKF